MRSRALRMSTPIFVCEVKSPMRDGVPYSEVKPAVANDSFWSMLALATRGMEPARQITPGLLHEASALTAAPHSLCESRRCTSSRKSMP